MFGFMKVDTVPKLLGVSVKAILVTISQEND